MKYTLEGQETERLKFRLLNSEDFDDCIELFKDIEVCRFLGVDKIETLAGASVPLVNTNISRQL